MGNGEDAVLQYCTTNVVLVVGDVVAKNYASQEAFEAETAILKRGREFPFVLPDLLYSHSSSKYGHWTVQQRVDGVTLAEAMPDDARLPGIVDQALEALVEFERRAADMLPSRLTARRWVDGIRPLVALLDRSGSSHAARTLHTAANACDECVLDVRRVPCFDLYLRNVLWRAGGTQTHVAFVDFDKATRLVPIGEQLSHLAVSPRLQNFVGAAVDRYSELGQHPRDLVQRLARIACFFRAMSGVRDSLPWSIAHEPRDRDPHSAERAVAFERSITAAARHIPELSKAVGGALPDGLLHEALDAVADLGREGGL